MVSHKFVCCHIKFIFLKANNGDCCILSLVLIIMASIVDVMNIVGKQRRRRRRKGKRKRRRIGQENDHLFLLFDVFKKCNLNPLPTHQNIT